MYHMQTGQTLAYPNDRGVVNQIQKQKVANH